MDRPIRVVIVDDEEPARARLRRFLEREPDTELVGTCCCGDEAVAAVRSLHPDLLLLDIQIPPEDGFAVLRELGDQAPPAVVFVTASEAHAVRAFEANALDYLRKPFSHARFSAALDRVRARRCEREAIRHRDRLLSLLDHHAADRTHAGYPNRLVVKTGSQLVFLDPAEIDWVEAEGVYVRLWVGTTSYLLRESLKHVEERLDPQRFIRIHRSTVLNVERVRKIVPHFNGGALVILRDGSELKMSRTYRDRVQATLG